MILAIGRQILPPAFVLEGGVRQDAEDRRRAGPEWLVQQPHARLALPQYWQV